MPETVIREWDLERGGEAFDCTYYSDDIVEVTHDTLGTKTTHAAGTDPETMARLLASQLLDRKP